MFCCCFNLKFYWACLIVHAFGIIVLIVSMSILPEAKLKYNCDESFYRNTEINDIYNKRFTSNHKTFTILSGISIGCFIVSLLFSICFKLCENKNNDSENENKCPSEIQKPLPQPINIEVKQNDLNKKQIHNNLNNNEQQSAKPFSRKKKKKKITEKNNQ